MLRLGSNVRLAITTGYAVVTMGSMRWAVMFDVGRAVVVVDIGWVVVVVVVRGDNWS